MPCSTSQNRQNVFYFYLRMLKRCKVVPSNLTTVSHDAGVYNGFDGTKETEGAEGLLFFFLRLKSSVLHEEKMSQRFGG